MIVIERIEPEKEGDWVFIRTYSDSGKLIRQDGTGDLYSEAVDPDFTNRTYTETDIPIDEETVNERNAAKAEAYDILMGVKE